MTVAAPQITAPPASQTVVAGQTAVFSVQATGAGALVYQWYRNGQAIANSGAATLTIAGAQRADSGPDGHHAGHRLPRPSRIDGAVPAQ